MGEFNFVQWGKGVPVDYQRLNAMMLNDQYLKDKLDPSPRGILKGKVSSTTFTYTGTPGAANPVTSMGQFSNITFNCEASRMIKFTFAGSYSTNTSNSQNNNIYSYLSIDGGSDISLSIIWQQDAAFGGFPSFTYITPTALTQGTHTATVRMSGYDAFTLVGIQTLIIEDIGAWSSVA